MQKNNNFGALIFAVLGFGLIMTILQTATDFSQLGMSSAEPQMVATQPVPVQPRIQPPTAAPVQPTPTAVQPVSTRVVTPEIVGEPIPLQLDTLPEGCTVRNGDGVTFGYQHAMAIDLIYEFKQAGLRFPSYTNCLSVAQQLNE